MRTINPRGLLILASLACLPAWAADDEADFTQEFPVESCRFVPSGGSAFSLVPGRQLYLSNARCKAAGECDEEVWISVLSERKKIPLRVGDKKRTIRARVVEEFETADGEGEPLPDAWLAGRNGASPGIIMPDRASLLGSRYFQEIAPGVALDRAEHVRLGLEVEVPAGVFQGCVEIEESSPLEPAETSTKIHCPGVGLAIDDDLELVAVYGRAHDDD